jgi:hypothetical protein
LENSKGKDEKKSFLSQKYLFQALIFLLIFSAGTSPSSANEAFAAFHTFASIAVLKGSIG